uniref:Odorant receptor n=1 Tax=Sirex nitobei TaxID=1602346 RepID=A0A857N3N2_9HYME|nr:odorant receptor 21a [Sirex nitobei]
MDDNTSGTTMEVDLSQTANLLMWNRRIFNVMGLWPPDINDRLFFFLFGFLTVHCCLEYAQLFQYIDQFDYVITNLSESSPLTMVLVKLGVYRINAKRLCRVLDDIIDDYKVDRYKTREERLAFLKYNEISKRFIKFAIPAMCFAATIFYFKPLTGLMRSKSGTENSSRVYVLPYQTRTFFEITETRTYISIYAVEGLILPVLTCGYTGTDCFMITLILHVCSQFSILALRMKNITTNSRDFHSEFSQLIVKHLRLIRIAKSLDDVFNILLLPQLLGTPIILCLGAYNLLHSPGSLEQGMKLLVFVLFSLCMLFVLFGYCYIGECLINESTSFSSSLYNSQWYNIPPNHAKLLIICMCQVQQPLRLTAGRFYVFSLEKFTDIIKTSMAYLSLLRTFI